MHRRLFLTGAVATLSGCGAGSPRVSTSAPQARAFAPGAGFADLDPVQWRGKAPMAYGVHGIDVSHHNGPIDWQQVRAGGISFAFIKATEGGDLLDPLFAENRRGARRAGVRNSAYHFFYFCRPAIEQARWFIQNVPRDRSALPHVLDMEWNPFSPTCRLRPDGATVRAEAEVFLDRLEQHYGRRPIIYTTPDFYKTTGIGQLRGTEFWLRSVSAHPREVYPGTRWTFWQYTGTGLVPGVSGGVDINVFNGTADRFAAWA